MKFPAPVSIKWIASLINAELPDDVNAEAKGINEIHSVEEGDIVFVDHPKYYNKCLSSAASFIIINKKIDAPAGKILLVVKEPFEAYLKVVEHFSPFVPAKKPISDTAVIGKNTVVMPNVFIGNNVNVGNNCIIHPNVSIYDNCIIGNNVVVHSGTIIGSDAFYFNTKKNREVWFKKMESCGRVVIEDDVEIGAGTTIDRASVGESRIRRGTKIDNLVQIGHSCTVGEDTLLCAQVGLAGSSHLGNRVILAGQAGVAGHLTLGDDVVLTAKSATSHDVPAGKVISGIPAFDNRDWLRSTAAFRRLGEMQRKIRELEKRLEELIGKKSGGKLT